VRKGIKGEAVFNSCRTNIPNATSPIKLLGVIDVPGILLFAVGLIALLVGLLSAKSTGHFSMWNIVVVSLLYASLKSSFQTAPIYLKTPELGSLLLPHPDQLLDSFRFLL